MPASRESWRLLPRSIWVLGFVSLLMDLSSELIHALLPLFLVSVLGTSVAAVGIIEGIAEATASIVKLFSGSLSDRWRHRKWIVVTGYALAAITKPFFPLANSVTTVFTARFIDRIGKGIRGAPRDALIADITPPQLRGASYGLRQSLDTLGAVLGPLAAVALMALLLGDIRMAMWFAVVPATFAVLLLVTGVQEPPRQQAATGKNTLDWRVLRELPRAYWFVVVLGAVFTLARFSEAFLVLRAHDIGLSLTLAPLVMVLMNVVYAALSYPAGAASDRMGTRGLLLCGMGLLVVADLVLAFAASATTLMLGAALWGAHMAFTQGLLARLVADAAPADLRGTGFGLFNLATGLALLLASLLAGLLWQYLGPAAAFIAGAAFAALAAAGLLLAPRTATTD